MGLNTEFGGNDAGHARGPVQQRVTHGAGDFVDRRIGGGDIQQPALAFIERQALGFDLQGELRNLEASEARTLGRRAAAKLGTLRVRGIQQPSACLGDIPLARSGLVKPKACMLAMICASCAASCTRALPACGRSEAIARSWIRSAIQGSVMGDIREGLGDGLQLSC